MIEFILKHISVFDLFVNAFETFLIMAFLHTLSQTKKPHYIASIIYVLLGTLFITVINITIHIEDYFFLIDILLMYIYLSIISKQSFARKSTIAILAEIILYVINIVCLAFTFLIAGERDAYLTIVEQNYVLVVLISKLLLLFVYYFASKRLIQLNLSLRKKDYYMISVAGLIMIAVMTALVDILMSDIINPIYVCIAIIGISSLLFLTFHIATEVDVFYKTQRQADIQIQKLQERNESNQKLLATQEELMKMRHDLKHLLVLIDKPSMESDNQTIRELINKYKDELDALPVPISTSNTMVNRIVDIYRTEAKKQGIDFTCSLNITRPIPMKEDLLALLLSNILDNAIQHIGKGKQILLEMKFVSVGFRIRVINSIDGHVLDDTNHFIKHRREKYHGYGMDTIEEAVKASYGKLYLKEQGNCVVVTVLILSEDNRELLEV